jgi:hypothetical protein
MPNRNLFTELPKSLPKSSQPDQVCRCNAYKFPHRLGSGKCSNTSTYGPFCSACGNSCTPIMVDFGIGYYEYWGATGVHRDIQEVSDCCESGVVTDQKDIDRDK